jgi:hypothetical protein
MYCGSQALASDRGDSASIPESHHLSLLAYGATRARHSVKLFGQNRCDSGLCPLTGILHIRKNNVSETGSVSILRCGGRYRLSWVH